MQYMDAISKTTEWSVCFQGKPLNSMVIQTYDQTSNAEEAEVEWFYEDLQDLLELTAKKDVLFIIGDWNAKAGSQEIPGVRGKFGLKSTEWSRLIEFCQENTLIVANTLLQQYKKRLYTWTSPDGQHQYQIDYKFAAKDGEALYSQQKSPKCSTWMQSQKRQNDLFVSKENHSISQ